MIVTITTTDTQIAVVAPYNPEFVDAARRIAGKWHAADKSWRFDIRDEARVRELCQTIYGSDGRTQDLVTVRVRFEKAAAVRCGPIAVAGRTIARAFGRDGGAKLGDGVILESGGFRSGGSVKNWETQVVDGTAVLVRDFPRATAEQLGLDIVDEAPVIDRVALQAERDRLVARIAEIDALLTQEG